MRFAKYLWLAVSILGATQPACAAKIYQWTDENGRVHFSDRAPAITKPKDLKPLTYKNNDSVQFYTTSWCPHCKKARDYMDSAGIRYTEYDIEKSEIGRVRHERLRGKTGRPGKVGVPLFVVGKEIIIGFSQQKLDAALEASKD